ALAGSGIARGPSAGLDGASRFRTAGRLRGFPTAVRFRRSGLEYRCAGLRRVPAPPKGPPRAAAGRAGRRVPAPGRAAPLADPTWGAWATQVKDSLVLRPVLTGFGTHESCLGRAGSWL